jgi:acetoin utilization protein AcuB
MNMLVGERMTSPALTIGPEMGVQDALALMHRDHVRRFPVVDSRGNLVGIISEKDLLNATPSDATTLSVWEINYLLSKLTVEKIMTKNVITITRDTPLEEAARIMADKKIGGLPVVEGLKVVGIVTETDIFKLFTEILGARVHGIRLTVQVIDEPGGLYKLTGAISRTGANIISLTTFQSGTTGTGVITVKVTGVDQATLEKAIKPVINKIVDIRSV